MDKRHFIDEETHKGKNVWSEFNINDDWGNSIQHISEMPVYRCFTSKKVKSLIIPNIGDDVEPPYDSHVAAQNENFWNDFVKQFHITS